MLTKSQKSMAWLLAIVMLLIVTVCVYIAVTQGSSEAPLAKPGEKIYYQYCAVCHQTGVANAPRPNDNVVWPLLYRQAGGMPGLLQSVKQGKSVMPPMGTCRACTDAQLQQAIEYMMPNSKQ